MLSPLTLSLFALGLVAAAVTDLRARRIPNALTGAGIAAGLALSAAHGWAALAGSVAGAVVALALGALLMGMGVLGGGDAKLLAMVGAFLGLAALPRAFLLIALAGGALGVLTLAAGLLRPLPATASLVGARPAARSVSVPYGVAIAVGALAAAFARGGP